MITLPLFEQDLPKLNELIKMFYSDQFKLPDFRRNFITTFKILNNENQLITAGGVKLNPELILITDKERTQTERMFALMSALQIASLASYNSGHELLGVSVMNDPTWLKLLKSYGFRESNGTHLVIG